MKAGSGRGVIDELHNLVCSGGQTRRCERVMTVIEKEPSE